MRLTENSVLTKHQNVYTDHGVHNSENEPGADLKYLESLRRNFPDYHATPISSGSLDLLGFAEAGYAEAKPQMEDEAYNSILRFNPPPGVRHGEKGSLCESFGFIRHEYRWNGKFFLLYQMTSDSSGLFTCILAPRAEGKIKGTRHSDVEELLFAVGEWSIQVFNQIFVFDGGCWRKDNALWKSVSTATWDDVVLSAATKENLIDDVHGFFENQKLYEQFSVPWKRGIILHGVPGNGKTLSIKAIMSELYKREQPIPALYVKSFKSENGSEHSIRQIFYRARVSAPCLLVFEDLDTLVKKSTRSYFLNEVDGLENNDGILMIGSTNDLELLDPAISKRPSRFDRKYHFAVPDDADRAAYCKYWKHKFEQNGTLHFPDGLTDVVTKITRGFSFAYLKELFVTAMLIVAQGSIHKPSSDAVTSKAEICPEVFKLSGGEEVVIPEDLRSNDFMRAFATEAQTLHSEMDSTNKKKRKPSKGNTGDNDSDDPEDSDDAGTDSESE